MSSVYKAVQLVRGSPSRLPEEAPRFALPELVGRMCELSGQGESAVLTLAVGLVRDAQLKDEPVGWVTSTSSAFYPPDLARNGVDLRGLVVVRVPQGAQGTLGVAAERLLRSGAFGLVVLDLGEHARVPGPLQARLLGLVQRHQSVLLCLTEKSEDTPSLGSLVSLRAQARRKWLGGERFECELHVLKDKRRGPVWSQREVCHGPLGLR